MSASFFLSCSLGTCSYSNVRIKVFPLKTQDSSPIRRWHLSSKLHSNSLKCVQLLSTHCATKCHCILKEHQLRLSTKFKMEPLEKEYLITYHSPKCNADFSVTWTLSAMNLSDAIIYFQMLLYGNTEMLFSRDARIRLIQGHFSSPSANWQMSDKLQPLRYQNMHSCWPQV